MQCTVLNDFHESDHKNILYKEGELYPKYGFEALPERLTFLQTDENRYKKAFLGPVIKVESKQEVQNINPISEEIKPFENDYDDSKKVTKVSKSKKPDSKE